MSFSYSAKGDTRESFLEDLGEQVVKTMDYVEQQAIRQLPDVDDKLEGLKRQQAEAKRASAHDAVAQQATDGKALVRLSSEAVQQVVRQIHWGAKFQASVNGHFDQAGNKNVQVTVSASLAAPAAVGAEAEMKAEGLGPSQVSGPSASPAAAARVAAAAGNPPAEAPTKPAKQ